jgi:N-acetylglucosaminyldiphosphoundecaprenol N-acetyl-beta-D-mannosaminyltransferase
MSVSKVGRFSIYDSPKYFFKSLDQHLLSGKDCEYFVCMNPHSYAVALNDSDFFSAVDKAKWIIPDGIGIKLASIFTERNIQSRITGYDVFEFLLDFCQENNKSLFLLGGSELTLAEIESKLGRDFPKIKLAGSYSPPFRDEFSSKENQLMLDKVNQSGADILLVSMSAPKQEKWIFKNRHALTPTLCCPIGAVFDFYIGRVKRSPKFFRTLGLEWLPRLVQEPRRLWRRVFVSTGIFIIDIFKLRNQERNK